MLTLLVLWSVLTGAAATIEGKVCSLLPKSYEIEFITVSLQRLFTPMVILHLLFRMRTHVLL